MAGNNSEGQEIDLLIQELSQPAPKPSRTKPVTSASATAADQPSAAPTSAPIDSMRAPLPSITIPPRLDEPGEPSGLPVLMLMTKLARHRLPAWMRLAPTHWMPRPRWLRLPRVFAAKRQENIVRGCVALGVALCVAMPYWPYPKACTSWLAFYFFAITVVVIAGIWAARLTWVTRQAVAHVVALGIVLWGITLAAEETLGLGYAKAEAIWFCQW